MKFEKKDLIIYAIIIIAVIVILKKTSDAIGFSSTPSDRAATKKIRGSEYLKPNYWEKVRSKFKNWQLKSETPKLGYYAYDSIGNSKATELAQKIYSAKAGLSWDGVLLGKESSIIDNSDKVFDAFGQINKLSDVILIAKKFDELYKKDLGVFLDFMKTERINELMNIINKMPTGVYKEQQGKWKELDNV